MSKRTWLPPAPGSLGTYVPSEQIHLRLFCAPSAGMGAWTCYGGWRDGGLLPSGLELLALDLHAHGMRMSDPLPYAASIPELACKALDGIGRDVLLARPFALFGHSFGAWLVYEMCQELARRASDGWPMPLKIYVSACRAPQLSGTSHDADREHPRLGDLDAESFWYAFERRYGCNPDLQCERVRSFVLGVLQADFRLLESYEPSTLAPLEVPLCALCAQGDARCRPAQLSAWTSVAGVPEGFQERWFEGTLAFGHWATEHRYVTDSPASLLRFLRADLPLVGSSGEAGYSGVDGPMDPNEEATKPCAIL